MNIVIWTVVFFLFCFVLGMRSLAVLFCGRLSLVNNEAGKRAGKKTDTTKCEVSLL